MRASIIIVNWNGREHLLGCLGSIGAAVDPQQVEVIVVDNASSDGSVEAVRASYPWAKVIANDKNVGYAPANNQAYAVSRGEHVLLLNPDAELTPGAVEAMSRALDTLRAAGAVTARLVHEGGDDVYMHRFPTLTTMLLAWTFVGRLLPGRREKRMRRYLMQDADLSATRAVPQPGGACLMVRREAVGHELFDERFPLLFNDVDLCKRIWDSGYRIYYVRDAVVRHARNKGGIDKAGPLIRIEYMVSMMRYFTKHHPRWESLVLRAVVLLHYLALYLLSLLTRFRGRASMPFFGESPAQGLRMLDMLLRCRSFFDGGNATWQPG